MFFSSSVMTLALNNRPDEIGKLVAPVDETKNIINEIIILHIEPVISQSSEGRKGYCSIYE
jgi:hypothetical protein